MMPAEPSLNTIADDLAAIERIDAVPRMLEVVCRTTGMGFAAVARVTDTQWVACAVRDEIAFGLKPGGELPLETTICNEIRQHGQVVVIDDVSGDGAFVRHHTPKLYGFRSYISVPVILQNGAFFGTLCAIDPQPARLSTPEVVGMFTLFAELIAFHLAARDRVSELEARVAHRTTALDRANRELQDRIIAGDADRAALRSLAARVERVREEERTRIARELHDELGQALTALKLQVEMARKIVAVPSKEARTRAWDAIDAMVGSVDVTLDSVERIVSELRPAVLDALGLSAAIEWLVEGLARRTGIRATCACADEDEVDPAVATALFRIAQEALTNVSKHARASEVRVILDRDHGDVLLTVTDDGCGLPETGPADPNAHGLLGMRERMRALNGTMAVTNRAGGGVQLVARCAAQEGG